MGKLHYGALGRTSTDHIFGRTVDNTRMMQQSFDNTCTASDMWELCWIEMVYGRPDSISLTKM